jgi:hypothetical protein
VPPKTRTVPPKTRTVPPKTRTVPPKTKVGPPKAGPRPTAQARAAAGPNSRISSALPRMPFVLLVLGLLGGGLICLLVINTTLGAASFRISQLQDTGTNLTTQEQTLQGQIASERNPAQIEKRAHALGMRHESDANILDLRTHRYCEVPGQPGVMTTETTAGTDTAAGGTVPGSCR